MAISFLNVGTEGSVAGGNVTPGAPASPQNDDIWICVAHSSDQNAHTMSADWTQTAQFNGGGTTSRLSVWWHRYAGVDPSRLVTISGATTQRQAGIAAFRGCIATGSPIDTVGTTNAGTDATAEALGITPVASNCMLLACYGAADDNAWTLPAGMTVTFQETTTNRYGGNAGTPDGAVAAFYELWTSGATGDRIGTQAAADPWAAVLIALKPAGATPTPTRGRISFAELETPFVPTRGRISWAELEAPFVPTRGRISFAELEVPTTPTRGRVSWTELEVPGLPTRGRISWAELEVPDVGVVVSRVQRLHFGIRISSGR